MAAPDDSRWSGQVELKSTPSSVSLGRSKPNLHIATSSSPTPQAAAYRKNSPERWAARPSARRPEADATQPGEGGAGQTMLSYLFGGSGPSAGAKPSRSPKSTARSRRRKTLSRRSIAPAKGKNAHLPAEYRRPGFVHYSRRTKADWEAKKYMDSVARRNTFFSPTPYLKAQPSPLSRQSDISGRRSVTLNLLAQEYWTESAERRQSSDRPSSSVSQRLYMPNHDLLSSTMQFRRCSSAATVTRAAETLRMRPETAGVGSRASLGASGYGQSAMRASTAPAASGTRGGSQHGHPRAKTTRGEDVPEDKISVFERASLQPDSIRLINRVESTGTLRHRNPQLKRDSINCSKGPRRIKSALHSRRMRSEKAERWNAPKLYLSVHKDPDFPVQAAGGRVALWPTKVVKRVMAGSVGVSLGSMGGSAFGDRASPGASTPGVVSRASSTPQRRPARTPQHRSARKSGNEPGPEDTGDASFTTGAVALASPGSEAGARGQGAT